MHICLDNEIDAEGARSLAESLKQNATLVILDIFSMLELHELLFVASR